MTQPPEQDDSTNRIVAVTLDEDSIGRSGPCLLYTSDAADE